MSIIYNPQSMQQTKRQHFYYKLCIVHNIGALWLLRVYITL